MRSWCLAGCLLAPLAAQAPAEGQDFGGSGPGGGRAGQSMNPDISVIVDGYFFCDDSDEGLGHVLSEIAGFGHTHAAGEDHHHGPDQGFNLNHLELMLSGEIDPAFKGRAIVGVTPGGAELEEAVIETTSLPGGLGFKFGKFFSDFGRINPQHSHEWDFTEGPLVNLLMFGAHGVNDVGLQVSWLAPTTSYLMLGAEAFQGENEATFPCIGAGIYEDPSSPGTFIPTGLGDAGGPRVGIAWLKYAPPLEGAHGIQLGASFGTGRRQESHDGDSDGTLDHWLDGDAEFWGVDAVYKYDSPEAYGRGDVTLQCEYVRRDMDVEVMRHDLVPALVGRHKVDAQDGYHVQLTYGFAPRWRVGARWEEVGLTNRTELPDGSAVENDRTDRLTLMFDFSHSEFSRLRLEVSRGHYATEAGVEDVWAAALQLQVSLGTHGAHKF